MRKHQVLIRHKPGTGVGITCAHDDSDRTYVSELEPDGEAARAGLCVGDILHKVGGVPVENHGHAIELMDAAPEDMVVEISPEPEASGGLKASHVVSASILILLGFCGGSLVGTASIASTMVPKAAGGSSPSPKPGTEAYQSFAVAKQSIGAEQSFAGASTSADCKVEQRDLATMRERLTAIELENQKNVLTDVIISYERKKITPAGLTAQEHDEYMRYRSRLGQVMFGQLPAGVTVPGVTGPMPAAAPKSTEASAEATAIQTATLAEAAAAASQAEHWYNSSVTVGTMADVPTLTLTLGGCAGQRSVCRRRHATQPCVHGLERALLDPASWLRDSPGAVGSGKVNVTKLSRSLSRHLGDKAKDKGKERGKERGGEKGEKGKEAAEEARAGGGRLESALYATIAGQAWVKSICQVSRGSQPWEASRGSQLWQPAVEASCGRAAVGGQPWEASCGLWKEGGECHLWKPARRSLVAIHPPPTPPQPQSHSPSRCSADAGGLRQRPLLADVAIGESGRQADGLRRHRDGPGAKCHRVAQGPGLAACERAADPSGWRHRQVGAQAGHRPSQLPMRHRLL